MAARVIVRFSETQGYDIWRDCEVARFMATMSSGSFWCEVPVEGPRSLRQDREHFKSTVVEMIGAGASPCEVVLEDEHGGH